jgi:hypothetical protein
MARVWSGGFELNSTTAGVEFTVITNGTIQSSVVRTGNYAGQITSLVSATARGFLYAFLNSAASGHRYFRVYLRVGTRPSADNTIITLSNTNANVSSGAVVNIKLSSTGTLKLFNSTTQIGSASAALNNDQWYCIELRYDTTGIAGTNVLDIRLNGVSFASATNLTVSNIMSLCVGGNLGAETQTQGNWYFDDLAVNDTTGSFQNSWIGEGSVIRLLPNAAGDNNQLGGAGVSTNYQNVDEITPDDATTHIDSISDSVGDIDEYNLASPGVHLTPNDTIRLVQVGFRFAGGATNNDSFVLRVKASSGGTVEESSTITPTGSAYATNAVSPPRNYPFTLYDLPGASTTAWTPADIETIQIGWKKSADNTAGARLSNIWLYVDSVKVDSELIAYSATGANSPADAPVNRVGVNETFATIRAGAGNQGGLETTTLDRIAALDASTTSNQYDQLHRSVLNFDTSSIPDNATITEAALFLWVNFKNNALGSNDLHISGHTPASTASVPATEFGNFGNTSFGSVAYADVITGQYTEITINSTGLAAINKTGVTSLGLRLEWDINNSTTGLVWASGATTRYEAYFADDATRKPRLVVRYSVPNSTTSTVQKSLKYAVRFATTLTKQLKYLVRTTAPTVQKSLTYRVRFATTITKQLQYRVRATLTQTKSLKYAVYTTRPTIQKTLRYFIKTSTTQTKSLVYRVRPTFTITKQLIYRVRFSQTITKQLKYSVRFSSTITKGLVYKVRRSFTQTKQLKYAVKTSSTLTKQLIYKVRPTYTITKSLRYVVVAPANSSTITKSLKYTVRRAFTITKQMVYAIRTTSSVTKSLRYAVRITRSPITKQLQYSIKTSSTQTKQLKYAIRRTTTLTKQSKYTVRFTAAITKSLTYYVVSSKLFAYNGSLSNKQGDLYNNNTSGLYNNR